MEERAKLETQIAQDECQHWHAVEALDQSLRTERNLRARIQERPLPWVVGPFVAGILLGARG